MKTYPVGPFAHHLLRVGYDLAEQHRSLVAVRNQPQRKTIGAHPVVALAKQGALKPTLTLVS